MRTAGSGTFRSLHNPNFRLFASGQLLSNTGMWMQMVAVGLLVLDLTDSGVVVGLVTATQFVPMLVLGAWAGVLADRSDRHRRLIVLNAVGAVVATVFAVLVLTDRIEVWSIFLLTLLSGTVTALENPARRSFVTDIVGRTDIANAVGLNSTLMTGARTVGAAAAGGIITGPGIGWCFAANAVSYVPQLWLFAHMDRTRFQVVAPVAKVKGQLVEGLRYAWSVPGLRHALLLVSVVSTLAFNFPVVLPLLSTRDLDGGTSTYTTLFSLMSAGSVLGGFIVARRTHADTRIVIVGTLTLGVSMAALAVAPTAAAAFVLVVPVGVASVLIISGANAVVQLNAAPAMRGRVLALLSVVFLGASPAGGPIAGAVAEGFGARWALAMGALASSIAAIVSWRALHRDGAGWATDPLPTDPSIELAPDGRGLVGHDGPHAARGG